MHAGTFSITDCPASSIQAGKFKGSNGTYSRYMPHFHCFNANAWRSGLEGSFSRFCISLFAGKTITGEVIGSMRFQKLIMF
jgi:hypothetical protein